MSIQLNNNSILTFDSAFNPGAGVAHTVQMRMKVTAWGYTQGVFKDTAASQALLGSRVTETGLGNLANGTFPAANVWVTLTWVFDGTYWKKYNDATLNITSTVDASAVDWLWAIARAWNGSTFVAGEIRIFNKALSLAEIQANYNIRCPVDHDGLVRLYRCDETSGTALADSQTNVTAVGATLSGTAVTFTPADDPFAAPAAVISGITGSGASETAVTVGVTTDQASGTLYAVVDTAANLSGITDDQIIAGTNNADAAPIDDGSAAVSTTTPLVPLSSGTYSIGSTYSIAAVQVNANGNSNVLTGTFTVEGLSIGSMTTPFESLQSATINVALAGATEGTVNITDSVGTVVPCVVDVWPGSGSGGISVDVPDVFENHIKPGAITVTVNNAAEDDSDAAANSITLEAGWESGVITGISATADGKIEVTPALEVGDIVATQMYLRENGTDAITPYRLIVDYSKATGKASDSLTVPAGSYYFMGRVFDPDDNKWSAAAFRINVVISSQDILPNPLNFGAALTNQEPGAVTIRNTVISGMTDGVDATWTVVSGPGQLSTDGISPASSVVRQNGQAIYLHVTAPALGQTATIVIACNGVQSTFSVSSRAASLPVVAQQPQAQSITIGAQASINIAGTNIDHVEWTVNGDVVAGQSGLTLAYTPPAVGVYTIAGTVYSPEGGQVALTPALLTVIAAATRLQLPADLSDGAGISQAGQTTVIDIHEADTVNSRVGAFIYRTTITLAVDGVTNIDSNQNGPAGTVRAVCRPQSSGLGVSVPALFITVQAVA